MSLKPCDIRNAKQRISYDPKTQMFRNTAVKDDHQCFYGRGLDVVGTGFTTRTCDTGDPGQRFGFRYQDEALVEQQVVVDAVASGQRFMLRVAGTNNSCLDDAGQAFAMQPRPCDTDRMNQYSQWDASSKRIRPRQSPHLCLDSGFVNFVLCDLKSATQELVYDRTMMQLRQSNKCIYRPHERRTV